jgi:hypothetical protein
MKFERAWTGNWENAFHGLRHPMESYAKGDTGWYDDTTENEYKCFNQALDIDSRTGKFLGVGPNDMDLAQRMIAAGTPNDKFLRQIFVSIDITAPRYWWSEMDTYKVGTTANSTSTMHKLASTPITIDCFEMDDFDEKAACVDIKFNFPYEIIDYCEELRQKYLETKDIRYWKELIRWLPASWLQTRTWTADYSVLRNIYHWRKTHKLTEWHQFCDFIVNNLPYGKELIEFDN